MSVRLKTDDEIKTILDQLLPEDFRMLRRLDDENFLQDGELTPEERMILEKLAGFLLAQPSSPGRGQQWIPTSDAKKALNIWDSIGRAKMHPPEERGTWIRT